jgi:hypothetical protein
MDESFLMTKSVSIIGSQNYNFFFTADGRDCLDIKNLIINSVQKYLLLKFQLPG